MLGTVDENLDDYHRQLVTPTGGDNISLQPVCVTNR
jgi:hypothetical protein